MLKELKSQHRNIIQMSFNGYSNNEISERLGMAHTTVSIILRSPLGQAYLNGLQDRAHEATLDVRKKLVGLNKVALDTFARLLNPKEKAPHSVQYNAAKDVLDRNGYKAPDRLNIDMTFQTKTDEELDAEIAAIEASINNPRNVRNLPETNTSPQQTTLTDPSSLNSFATVPSATLSPDLEADITTEEELSLEDFSYAEYDQEFVNTPIEVQEFEIAGLPADLFRR